MRLVAVGLFLLLSATYASPGQQDAGGDRGSPGRAEELMAERQARLARVQPARESRVIDLVTTIETEGFDQLVTVQLGDFRAGFGKISPVSSFTPALRYEQPQLGRTELSLHASGAYSVSGYQAYNFKLGIFDEPAPADFLGAGFLGAPFDFDQRSQRPTEGFIYADLGFRGFPDEILYGLGSHADESSPHDPRRANAYRLLAEDASAASRRSRAGCGGAGQRLPSKLRRWSARASNAQSGPLSRPGNGST